jgi:cysteine desulfurase
VRHLEAHARHYLDHASTVPPRPETILAMLNCLEQSSLWGDPARIHVEGRATRVAVEEAREKVAELLGTRPRQVIFTSGGTEAVNAAAWGALRALPGRPALIPEVEHSSVRAASERLAPCVPVPVQASARVDPAAVEEALDKCEADGEPAALVHCQAANHEVGTLQPVTEVVALCRDRGVMVHVDACAAAGHVPLALDDLGADLVSVSAHKLGGPPGTGALVVRRGLRVDPFIVGGDQERARRAGLENVPAIVGFGAAAEILSDPARLDEESSTQRRLTDLLLQSATSVEGVSGVGDISARVPHIVCVEVEGVEAEPVLLALDQAGIAAHSGSSCSSESLAPSPVLAAMGADPERSLRLSVGWSSTDSDVEAFAEAFPEAVGRLRALRT